MISSADSAALRLTTSVENVPDVQEVAEVVQNMNVNRHDADNDLARELELVDDRGRMKPFSLGPQQVPSAMIRQRYPADTPDDREGNNILEPKTPAPYTGPELFAGLRGKLTARRTKWYDCSTPNSNPQCEGSTMPENFRSSLLRLQYEEPTKFNTLVQANDMFEQAFVEHLRHLEITCGNGSPLPRCTWVPVIGTSRHENPELTNASITFALATPSHLRDTVYEAAEPGATVDATYVTHEGKQHLIMVLSDTLMQDDQNSTNDPILEPPGPLGKAVEQAAGAKGATARHWNMSGGDAYWEAAIAEEMEWIRQFLGEDPGTDRDFRSGLENATL